MLNSPLIKDISEPVAWRYAIGSPDFIVIIEAAVPPKGSYDINPVFSINSKLNPTKLSYQQTNDLTILLAKTLEVADRFIRAARYEERFINVGRTVWIRNESGIYQIVGIYNPREKEFLVKRVDFDNSETRRVSLWDMIPIIEPLDL